MQDSHQDSTTQIYNLGAEEYKKSCEEFIFPWNMFEYFLEALSGKKILDVWCAFGRDVLRLRNNWYEAYGIDISKKLIEISDRTIHEYLTEWNMTQLVDYYLPNSFDGGMSSATLVHIDKDIAKYVLKNIYNLLRNNWVFFLTLKISDSQEVLFKNSISLKWIEKKYVYYKQSEILNILINMWFDILKTHIQRSITDDWLSIICKK